MKLIVGLGNPGNQYSSSRHNLGFRVIDALNVLLGTGNQWVIDAKHNCQLIKTKDAILIKPSTFMNNSGKAVRSVADYYQIAPSQIWVIHDDKDIPFAEFKIQQSRGSAGHNGVRSIIDHLGTNQFTRVRVGIKPPAQLITGDILSDFVLENFSDQEENMLKSAVNQIAENINTSLSAT